MYKKIGLLFVVTVLLNPVAVAGAPPMKVDAFVCPVLNSNVGLHNPNTFPIFGGDYSLIPSGTPKIKSVPIHATNNNGNGSPGGPHSSPGDTDYTAIWNNE